MIAGNRKINYLRISVTDRCNFRCLYCMPTSGFKAVKHDQIARYEEILKIVTLACESGVEKVRITGGEPFARKGIFSFIEKLCAIPQIKDVSITTNGSLLTKTDLERLKKAGIKRLNFSLDTLDPAIFKNITSKDNFQKVWDTILAAHEIGMTPVKINTVILKGINDHEITDIAALTLKYPFHIRFIELMPMGESSALSGRQVLTDEIRKEIEQKFGPLIGIQPSAYDGPAKKYQIKDACGIIGFITPVSSHFCAECNRIRLTSRGTIRPCLLNEYEKDIIGPLRQNADDKTLKTILETSLTHKPSCHNLEKKVSGSIPLSHMTSIGG